MEPRAGIKPKQPMPMSKAGVNLGKKAPSTTTVQTGKGPQKFKREKDPPTKAGP